MNTKNISLILPVSNSLPYTSAELIEIITEEIERGFMRAMKLDNCYARVSTTHKTYTEDFTHNGAGIQVPKDKFYLVADAVCLVNDE